MKSDGKIKKKHIIYSVVIIGQIILVYILASMRPEDASTTIPDMIALSSLFITIAIILIREAKKCIVSKNTFASGRQPRRAHEVLCTSIDNGNHYQQRSFLDRIFIIITIHNIHPSRQQPQKCI